MSLLYLQLGSCKQLAYQQPNCDNTTHNLQPKYQQLVCPYTTGLHEGWVKCVYAFRIWESNSCMVTPCHLFYHQVGNCNQTTYQCPNCDNATQLVQPKHQQLVCPLPQTATKQPNNNYTVTMQPAHLVQPKRQHQVCPIPLVCMNLGAKSCS
jgi:hypothetical protein